MKNIFQAIALTAGMLLAYGAQAGAAPDAAMQEALQDCDRNQMNMNLCAAHRHQQADQALNRQYRETLAKQSDDAARQRVRAAQRAWIVFRDKDCLAANGPREESGSIWPLLQADCLARHTERRTEDLKQQACGMEGCAER